MHTHARSIYWHSFFSVSLSSNLLKIAFCFLFFIHAVDVCVFFSSSCWFRSFLSLSWVFVFVFSVFSVLVTMHVYPPWLIHEIAYHQVKLEKKYCTREHVQKACVALFCFSSFLRRDTVHGAEAFLATISRSIRFTFSVKSIWPFFHFIQINRQF